MAASTRPLPTNSPVPYFQPIERGPMSEGRLSDMGSIDVVFATDMQMPSQGINLPRAVRLPEDTVHHPVAKSDRLMTYTGLDDYDTLFEARHGRGVLKHVPGESEEKFTSSMGITPPTLGTGLMVQSKNKEKPVVGIEPLSRNDHVPMMIDPLPNRMVSPSSEIIGEGAMIFTNMTETMLTTLDQQLAMSSDVPELKEPFNDDNVTVRQQMKDNPMKMTQGRIQMVSDTKGAYPNLFLPVTKNHQISDRFCGYSDSLFIDNNPMVLVELNSLSYQYGTSIYAIDRVNGTMYGKFIVGYRMIPERATIIPQFQWTPLENECNIIQPTYVNTLPGTGNIVTPLAKSMSVTQVSQMPISQMIPSDRRDILEPLSSEQARAAYLTKQIQGMSSVRLPSDMPSLEDTSNGSANLSKRIQAFCQEQKVKRIYEWESLKSALEKMKKSKEKNCEQQVQEEKDAIYAEMAQNLEKTRAIVRNSVSRASTISAEECQLTLTEDDFMAIQRKRNKIDQRLDELYKNWHAEYRDAVLTEKI